MAAGVNDEFDVEIESVYFDIESENCEPLSTQDVIEGEAGTSGTHYLPAEHKLQEFKAIEDNQEKPIECHQNNNLDMLDTDMDDGFDEFLSQIDENEIKSVSGGQEFPKYAKEVDNNSFELRRSISNQSSCHSENSCLKQQTSIFKKSLQQSENAPVNIKRHLSCESSFFSSQSHSSSKAPPLKRRFPGPAGILPLPQDELESIVASRKKVSETNPENFLNLNLSFHSSSPAAFHKLATISSPRNAKERSNDALLNKAPWKSLMKTLCLNQKDENDLLNISNIKWVRTKAKGCPEEMKIPFLAVVVQSEMKMKVASHKKKLRCKNPLVKLMDPTGTITAVFSSQFVEAYGDKIIPGTALALRNCGVMGSISSKQVLVTVPKKSLLCLATTVAISQEDNTSISEKDTLTECKMDNDVFVMQTGPFPREKIRMEYLEITNNLRMVDTKKTFQHKTDCFSSDFPNRNTLFTSISAENSNPQNLMMLKPPVETICHPNLQSEDTSGFDDDDDEELLLALADIDFVIDEDSM